MAYLISVVCKITIEATARRFPIPQPWKPPPITLQNTSLDPPSLEPFSSDVDFCEFYLNLRPSNLQSLKMSKIRSRTTELERERYLKSRERRSSEVVLFMHFIFSLFSFCSDFTLSGFYLKSPTF